MKYKRQQSTGRELAMSISGIIIFFMGILTLAGWITGIQFLTITPQGYIPMASSSACFFAIFGILFYFKLFERDDQNIRRYMLIIVGLMTLYGLLKFLEFFVPFDLTIEQYIFSGRKMLGNFQLNKMSNYSGLLFFISGIAVILKMSVKQSQKTINFIGNLGLIVAFAGFIASLGYAFGTPFLYSGKIIPLALTSAICFVLLGCGILTLSGNNNYLIIKLTGPQASARILRTFLPFLILENFVGDALEQYISRYFNINEALISAFVTLLSITVAIVITLYLTKIIFQRADKAEVERLKAEEALKESLVLSNTLLKTIPFGMDIIDENGTILFLNDMMKKSLGRDAVGSKCWEVYRDDKKQCTDCPLKSFIKIGETHTTESQNVLGGNIFEITHTGLMFNGNKAILEIFHDITERKHSEIKLKEYANELEVVNNTKNKLFNIIAHDLRSPFNTILGLSNLLNDGAAHYNEEDKKEIIHKLKESSESAYNLLENLLAWSLSQRNGIKVNTEKIDIHEIASIQLGVFENVALTKNIQVANQITPGTFAHADKNMVTTVMRNLLNNALKFTRPGGNIVLTAIANNGKIEVSFEDNGVGIEANIVSKMFKSTESYTTKGTDNENGTGLGLMVCKEFIEINGGEIWVNSKEDKGSKFSFTLPTATFQHSMS